MGRYWRKGSQSAADALYREALRLRIEEQRETDLVAAISSIANHHRTNEEK